MKRRMIGGALEVSDWCFGTMTFGNQTDEAEAHRQLSRARDFGLDFLDTAEMYPVAPVTPETLGRTEEYIGTWIAKYGRQGWKIATKITGEGGVARDGAPIDGAAVRAAVEESLRRLQTDHIDIYQFHWPNRGAYSFRQNWRFDPSGQDTAKTLAHMDDCLQALKALREEGKIGQFGLSNESAWGTIRWIDRAEVLGAPRVVTVQNEYSLLCRLWDTDMAEMSIHEGVTLLSYSPLAAGFLTGKYQGGKVPEGSRKSRQAELGGRASERVLDVVEVYMEIARRHGVDPVHMALNWQGTRPFPVMPIIGATTDAQLQHILEGYGTELSPELIEEIEVAHKRNPMPF
ncbi:aldo/keto reductase [Pseudoroseicyclus tamaricis]|uniref:Aldo/keto reductase n=1 Tax=Pseudoroseicyclus tamaricis TaxID=2705421 RepID=A0A6B2K1Z1_9RHOB|nr:aldo/keto reductase [Pseudoroseicyclus tamaricis]NDV00426.1 aldo/keto reductase [Pseudoroseicyclus tamaricis]